MKTHKGTSLLLLFATLCSAQTTPKIVIRFLNGKNGKPITDKQVTIELGGGVTYRDADSNGEIVLDISNVAPPEVRVRSDDRFDCRFERDQTGPGGLDLRYSLDEIISKGIVGKNLCGKAQALPSGGVLTLFLRPRTFLEKWKL